MEDKYIFRNWAVLVVGLVSLVLGVLIISHLNYKMFIENGYTRGTVKGSSTVQWIKGE